MNEHISQTLIELTRGAEGAAERLMPPVYDKPRAPASPTADLDLIALDDALEELKSLNPRHAKVVELRFFGGLPVKEAVYALDIAERTANNDGESARAWLRSGFRSERTSKPGFSIRGRHGILAFDYWR